MLAWMPLRMRIISKAFLRTGISAFGIKDSHGSMPIKSSITAWMPGTYPNL
jgi:hypothetical protein